MIFTGEDAARVLATGSTSNVVTYITASNDTRIPPQRCVMVISYVHENEIKPEKPDLAWLSAMDRKEQIGRAGRGYAPRLGRPGLPPRPEFHARSNPR